MKFKRKPVIVEAAQWFKFGDHPADGGTKERVSEEFRYFATANFRGYECSKFKNKICVLCNDIIDKRWKLKNKIVDNKFLL